MNNLPDEVLFMIFKQLHLKQKVECMLACRKFACILSAGYLFETINFGTIGYYLSVYEKWRDAIIEKARSEPHYGQNCKRLLIDTKIDIATLAATFPNLSFFRTSQDLVEIPPTQDTQNSNPFKDWKNNLETLFINASSMFSRRSILNQVVFNHLSTINSTFNPPLRTPLATSDIFPALHNAPALTSLSISGCAINITNLETLHSNAPQLILLTIENAVFFGSDNLQRLDIRPTEKLEVLSITNARRNIQGSDWLVDYIKLKYTHLDQFLYSENGISTNLNENEKVRPDWIDLVTAIGHRLKMRNVKLVAEDPQPIILSASLSIPLNDLGIYNALSLDNVSSIAQEPLLACVTVLSLDRSHASFQLSDLETLAHLKELTMSSILQMKISFNSAVANLTQSITSLVLKNAKIVIDELILDINSNITCLELYDSVMSDTDTSVFLAMYFQKLKSLTLCRCTLPRLIDLPDHHLDFVEYSLNSPISNVFTGYQLTLHDRVYYFSFDLYYIYSEYANMPMEKSDRSSQKVMRPSERIANVPYFHFRCASLKTAYFGQYYLLF